MQSRLELWKGRQEWKFKVIFSHIVDLRPAWAI